MHLVRSLVHSLTPSLSDPPDWTPPVTPHLWFDPSHLSTLFTDTAGTSPASPNDAIARLNNRGSASIHLTQEDSPHRPTLRHSSGLYYLEYEASNDNVLHSTYTIPSSQFTIILSFKTNTEEGGRLVWVWGDDVNNGIGIFCPADDIRQLFFVAHTPSPQLITVPVPDTPFVASLRFNQPGQTLQVRINRGSWVTLEESFGTNTLSAGNMQLGGGELDGNIYQFFLVPGLLTGTQLDSFEDHCASKAGITLP